jgi:hypothetical protein
MELSQQFNVTNVTKELQAIIDNTITKTCTAPIILWLGAFKDLNSNL